ncbi:hypothetical protein GXP67_02355 [Rhodocytophaga rosea]|uniref:Uncharacterized protein n=1 Tax=Rhodocytophaga rosea TaxID=2704465 RepID=A0A6C0GCL0_9BACT|nr:hypothetical protein [Rhodocytophaga rosea]QHT65584.1 hypothetical protein GXP67_02355 [Rhodocytophaga rosea]
MNTIAGKDFIILFKKVLVTLALYLIPVLTVCALLLIAKKFQDEPSAAAAPKEQLQVVDN